MLTPMLPMLDPHAAARVFEGCGWTIDFATEADADDRMAAVSLLGNQVLLGIAEPPFVDPDAVAHLGAGVALHCTVHADDLPRVHAAHAALDPTPLEPQPWGPLGFQVMIEHFRFMFVAGE